MCLRGEAEDISTGIQVKNNFGDRRRIILPD